MGFVLGRGGPLGGNGHHPHEVVPAAQAARFHHIGRVLSCSRPSIGPALNLSHFRAGRDASPMRGKVWAKGIGHQNQTVVGADRAFDPRFFPKVPCGTHEFGMRVTDLVDAEAAAAVFIDEVLARESVVDCTSCTS